MAEETKPTTGLTDEGQQSSSVEEQSLDTDLSKILENVDSLNLPKEVKEGILALKKKMVGEYTRKTQDVASKRKDVESLQSTLQSELKAIESLKAGSSKEKVASEVKEGVLGIDQLISEATTADERESLRRAKGMFLELAELKAKDIADKRVSEIEKKFENLMSVLNIHLSEKTDEQIASWKEEYGKDMILKHEKVLRESLVRYPDLKPSEILPNVLKDDYKLAVIASYEIEKKKETERKKNASTSQSNEGVASSEPIKKDRFGRYDIGDAIEKAVKKAQGIGAS